MYMKFCEHVFLWNAFSFVLTKQNKNNKHEDMNQKKKYLACRIITLPINLRKELL